MENIEKTEEPEKIVQGVSVIQKYWPWLNHVHRQPQTGAYVWSGIEPNSQITFKVTATVRRGIVKPGVPKLFDWELDTLRVSWDATDRIKKEKKEKRQAMDIDGVDNVEVDEEALKYNRIHTNSRLFPEQGCPGQSVWDLLQEGGCIPSKETLQMFTNILVELDCEDDYRELVLCGPNVWAMALQWNDQRLIFTIHFPALVEIEDRFKTLLRTPPTIEEEEEKEDEHERIARLMREAATPLWKITLHPDLVFFEVRTWREQIIWQRLQQHVTVFVSPKIPDESLIKDPYYDNDDDDNDDDDNVPMTDAI
jgi:hypothetical protein